MTFLEFQDSTLFEIKQNVENSVRGSAVRRASGLMNFAAAVAYHFCLGLPTALTQPWAHLLAEPCIEKCPACLWDKKFIPRGYWIWYTLLFIMSTGLKSFWRSPCGAGRGRSWPVTDLSISPLLQHGSIALLPRTLCLVGWLGSNSDEHPIMVQTSRVVDSYCCQSTKEIDSCSWSGMDLSHLSPLPPLLATFLRVTHSVTRPSPAISPT